VINRALEPAFAVYVTSLTVGKRDTIANQMQRSQTRMLAIGRGLCVYKKTARFA